MAGATVEFLLGNLHQLLTHQAHLLGDAKTLVENLETDLGIFKAFLKDSAIKQRKDERLRELVRKIRDVFYEAEDIIDAFVTQAAENQSKSYFLRAFQTPVKLHGIATEIERVSAKVKEIYGDKNRIDFASLSVGDGGTSEESKAPWVRQDNVVGFEDEAQKLIGYLTEETQQLDVISITGMPGLGKTTLAGKVFRDPVIMYEFSTRIWVYVSQEFTRKDIFLAILREFTRLDDDMYRKSDQELAQLVASHLERGKFLIVMDDVWTVEDWEKLQIVLPKSNKMGKVLITSRHVEVAQYVNRSRLPLKLRFLTQEESWLLLCLEVFGKPMCPPELESLVNLIANQCDGLPLAIVVIGDILVRKYSKSDDMSSTEEAWTKVSKSMSKYLSEDPVGQGFVQEKSDISLEETAETYLENLINRNLVRVEKMRPDGRVKTCRIHDMLHDFCIKEAGNERENFLQKMKSLMVLVSALFVCSSKDEVALPTENASAIPAGFKLLRVLEVNPIKFTKIPSDMYQLVQLRYLTLSINLAILPAAFSKLWNIQTLVVDTTSRTLEIKADIWKMVQLRHLKTNVPTTLPKTGKGSKEGENLQTLGTISPESCTEEVFERARNLKKLGIRGRLALLLEGKDGSFDSLVKLDNLEKLKLINDVFPHPLLEGQLQALPPPYKFPPKLKKLTLSASFLDWSHMSILGLLENLEVLKLKDNAFMGKHWKSTDGAHHFPQLVCLELQNCEELTKVPLGLAEIPSFQVLDLYRTKFASASAKKIGDAKKQQEEQNDKAGGFKLSIFPVDD
ncbi:UNVERIFIED_CONTAM: putative late blight resistance proteinR1A-10 [Sesamum latifolium]|uniref:Late blight resistance proteinR1A-10 n=1 Tax=Sesamum latifolium TaxID=2727402 RepID=A0AAW2UMJ4_9LAMI